jgi:hypothetical protein
VAARLQRGRKMQELAGKVLMDEKDLHADTPPKAAAIRVLV